MAHNQFAVVPKRMIGGLHSYFMNRGLLMREIVLKEIGNRHPCPAAHFRRPPRRLTVLGMNAAELDANPAATSKVVHDLNADQRLPFTDASFDGVVCCVSVDYLVRPIEVFREAARVIRPGGAFVCTFSNRCFPTKAIRGWLATDDEQHCALVSEYFRRAGGWSPAVAQLRTPPGHAGDPLYAVWATSLT